MLKQLQYDINQLTQKQQKQETQLSDLYIQFDEIYEKKQRLQNPILPKKNLFLSVRPEVLYQIFQFLDMPSILKIRQVNKDVNRVIHQIALLQCDQLIKQVSILETDLEEYKLRESQQETHLEQELHQAQQNMKQLDLRYLHQLRSISRAPVIIEIISYCLLVIYRPQFDAAGQIWNQALRFLQQFKIIEILTSFPVESISDEQLVKLAVLDQITKEQAYRVSIAAEKFYDLFKAQVDLRRTQAYINKHQIYQIEKKIQVFEKIIYCCQSI